VIWPNQKKVLGIVKASSDEKAAAARRAGMTSRINTMFSIPDALLHGGAAKCRAVTLTALPTRKAHQCARGEHVAWEPISLDSLPDWPD
jgi:hypothetical protein